MTVSRGRARGAEARLKRLEIILPATPTPVANYVRAVQSGRLLFLAGHVPTEDGRVITGKLGLELNVEDGYRAARLATLNALASAKAALGSLDRVTRVVKVVGLIASADGFTDQPRVLNGCSDLLVEIFGEAGRHARSAVGVNELPLGAAVEVELIFEVGARAKRAGGGRSRRRR